MSSAPKPLSRRHFLAASLASGAYAVAGTAHARAPLAGKQMPTVYRTKVGTIEVTTIADGYLPLPAALFAGIATDEADKMLAAAGLANPTPTSVMAYVVNTGDKLVLVDTGAALKLGATLGRLPGNLAAAGIDPAAIDVVALTHAHGDHVNGAITLDGKPAFPNAEFVISEAEYKFWYDDGILSQAPADAKPFFDMARTALTPNKARIRMLSGNNEVVPGIVAEAAPGHTPGHVMFRVSSGNQQLLIFGDIIHSAALQFARPDVTIAFDVDPALAARTRHRVLDMVSADKLRFCGGHIPFPGLGTAVKDGGGYRFAASPFEYAL